MSMTHPLYPGQAGLFALRQARLKLDAITTHLRTLTLMEQELTLRGAKPHTIVCPLNRAVEHLSEAGHWLTKERAAWEKEVGNIEADRRKHGEPVDTDSDTPPPLETLPLDSLSPPDRPACG